MSRHAILPPPQFRDDSLDYDYDIDARLEELNTNPIYQPPGHWLRELPYLDEIVNTDNAKYLHAELNKNKKSGLTCVRNVFGMISVMKYWNRIAQQYDIEFEYRRRRTPNPILSNNDIPYGRVHHCVIPSNPDGRIDIKWSLFHDYSKEQLMCKVARVMNRYRSFQWSANEEDIVPLDQTTLKKLTRKELIRKLIKA
jgi:hypothetical protein